MKIKTAEKQIIISYILLFIGITLLISAVIMSYRRDGETGTSSGWHIYLGSSDSLAQAATDLEKNGTLYEDNEINVEYGTVYYLDSNTNRLVLLNPGNAANNAYLIECRDESGIIVSEAEYKMDKSAMMLNNPVGLSSMSASEDTSHILQLIALGFDAEIIKVNVGPNPDFKGAAVSEAAELYAKIEEAGRSGEEFRIVLSGDISAEDVIEIPVNVILDIPEDAVLHTNGVVIAGDADGKKGSSGTDGIVTVGGTWIQESGTVENNGSVMVRDVGIIDIEGASVEGNGYFHCSENGTLKK